MQSARCLQGNGYNLAWSNIASIFRRDTMVNASDKMIARRAHRELRSLGCKFILLLRPLDYLR